MSDGDHSISESCLESQKKCTNLCRSQASAAAHELLLCSTAQALTYTHTHLVSALVESTEPPQQPTKSYTMSPNCQHLTK
eukprot:6108938-Amphidinium_carterae.1